MKLVIKLVGVSPLEALRIVEKAIEARSELEAPEFDLIVLKGEENLRRELREYWTPESSGFYALHIATDKPVVLVRADSPEDLLEASIYHEIGHVKLHGSRKFYEITIPSYFLPLGSIAPKVLYLLSIAVKDFEVSKLLSAKDLTLTQIPLIRIMLEPEPVLSVDPDSLALELASNLKRVFFLIPLIGIEATLRGMSDLPCSFLQWAADLSYSLGSDTIENVKLVARAFTEYLMSLRLFWYSIKTGT